LAGRALQGSNLSVILGYGCGEPQDGNEWEGLKPFRPKELLRTYSIAMATSHSPANFQVRLTVDSLEKVKELLNEYWTIKYMVFRHQPVHNPENVHYHVYLFELYRTADAMRKRFEKRGLAKEKYAVSVTAGKSKVKITPDMAYQYAMNPKSNPVLVESRGFNDEELAQFKTQAENHYKPVEAVLITREDHYVVRPDRVWERLCAELVQDPDKYDGKTIPQIKSMISVAYLRKLKAIPRPSDLHRYAVSLQQIVKHDLHINEGNKIEDDALVEEYMR